MQVLSNRQEFIPFGRHFRPWQGSASAGALIGGASLLCVTLTIDAYRPSLAPSLVPILLLALGWTLSLSAISLWNVRSAHRNADQAFRNADCEFSSIFRNVLDGIFILDNNANFLDVNPAAASLLRATRDELLGTNIRRFLPTCNDFADKWQRLLQRNGQRGRAELVAGDGSTVFVDFSAASNYLPGRHIFILCDVTERTRTEKALRESEERFQYVANNIQEIIWTLNAETKEVIYVNQAYTAITGRSVESLYQSPSSYSELIYPRDRIRVLSKLHDVVSTGIFDEEFRFIHANGSVRWIWVKAHPVRRNGQTRWLVGTAQDITSRKEAEKQIADHLDATEAARAEAEALRKATLALSQNLSMDSVLDTLLQCIGELVPFDKASVLFMDDPEHLFVAREAPHVRTESAICVLGISDNSFLQKVLFEHTPLLLSDTTKEPEWRETPPFDRTSSWLGIPLIAAGSVIGMLSLSGRAPSAFNTEHLRLAKNLAVSAAVAIENARAHERAEIYANELEARLHELHETQTALQLARKPPVA